MEPFDELFEMRQWQNGEDPDEALHITGEDKDIIMEHVHELFGLATEPKRMLPEGEGPITENDKRLIVWHIDELFLI